MTALFTGDIYDNSGHFMGSYQATGYVNFEFVGRNDLNSTGTWEAIMTQDNLTVSAFGHTFGLTLSGPADGGTLDISAFQPAGCDYDNCDLKYLITLTWDDPNHLINTNFNVDGNIAPFSYPLEESNLQSSLTSTPEPTTLLLICGPLAAMIRSRRSSRKKQ